MFTAVRTQRKTWEGIWWALFPFSFYKDNTYIKSCWRIKTSGRFVKQHYSRRFCSFYSNGNPLLFTSRNSSQECITNYSICTVLQSKKLHDGFHLRGTLHCIRYGVNTHCIFILLTLSFLAFFGTEGGIWQLTLNSNVSLTVNGAAFKPSHLEKKHKTIAQEVTYPSARLVDQQRTRHGGNASCDPLHWM